MTPNNNEICFKEKELAGSRLRCLMLTSQGKQQIADCFNELIKGYGRVDPNIHHWRPEGFLRPQEIQLGRKNPLLTDQQNEQLKDWWLAIDRGSTNLPNWDIISQATIDNKQGLVLIEAKAHTNELAQNDKSLARVDNLNSIRKSMKEASDALDILCPSGWKLQPDYHYQLCNRFAWSWKLSQMGIPVILIYLGFLNAGEMRDRKETPFLCHNDWLQSVHNYANDIVPANIWDQNIKNSRMPFRALIRSLDITYSLGSERIHADD